MNFENFDHKAISKLLKKLFKSSDIEVLARESKFIRRSTSQISGMDFLLMNVFDSTSGKERSLNDCCQWLDENRGVQIKKQSLDERYNTDSVRFMKMCLKRIMEMVNPDFESVFSNKSFDSICLTDSTSFKIPSKLSAFYEGGGKRSGEASIKLQLTYNLLDGRLEDLGIRSGKEHDAIYLDHLNKSIKKGSLYIRDLGYYKLNGYKSISNKEAYFISRGKSDAYYSIKTEKGFERIDFFDLLDKDKTLIERTDIYIGSTKSKLNCRLIIETVPEEVVAKRLKKLERQKQKKPKYNVSAKRKKMCNYNIYITNVPKQDLPAEMVRIAYKLRWQIELMFKIWKSVFDIDKVRQMSIFRFECYLYSKLISILITLHIHNKFSEYLWEASEFETSPMKTAKLIKKNYRN